MIGSYARARILVGLIAPVLLVLAVAPCRAQSSEKDTSPVRVPGFQPDGEVLLPNQWSLRPAGKQLVVNDAPVNAVLHPTEPFLVLLHAGQGTHGLTVVNTDTRSIVSTVELPQCFYGVTFSRDGKTLYASGAEHEIIHAFTFDKGYLSDHRTIRIVPADKTFVVSGLCTSPDDASLFACGVWGHGLAKIDLKSNEVTRVDLGKKTFPYTVLPDPDGSRLFVTCWGAASVAVLDAKTLKLLDTWQTPSHPTEMRLSPDAKTLYVACSNANQAAVLDTVTGKMLEEIGTALYPDAPNGSTPCSLDLSADGSMLAVANADNNNVALFNVESRGHAVSLGFIPVGWYASSVRFAHDGGLLVTNAKGVVPKANRHGPNPTQDVPGNLKEYIASIFDGTLSFIDPLTPEAVTAYTAEAIASSPLQAGAAVRNQQRPDNSPIPARVGESSPIKHCIYIIKENRTYDQIMGDMPEGNGDPTICLFPENVTPNHHAIARRFVLLDNFYVESEVSADGHEWSMGAYATDFVEKCWPLSYRGNRPKKHKLSYPGEGNFDIAIPSGGYLWDKARQAGITYRSYGEWVSNGATPDDPGKPRADALQGHIDPMYRGFDLDYPDLKRASRFIHELKRFEKEGRMPQLQIVRLPSDHTYGTRIGKKTPTAMVADNDRGLGLIIEAVSHSKFWKDTAIFVVEDDAQNGPDHVDAHRTVAFVVSPYTRREAVDSTMYSTSSMLRTMELILGLEPMSQYDAAALPMCSCFTAVPDFTPYKAEPAQVDLTERNQRTAWGADVSDGLDLSKEDAADDLVFNEIIWRSVRGADSPMPAPVRAAFVYQLAEHAENEREPDND